MVSLIKNVNKVNESAWMNTKQQQLSKWMCLQLMQIALFNGLHTNKELKHELAELKKDCDVIYCTCAVGFVKTGFNVS